MMEKMIVRMVQMNQIYSALLHVHLICLPVLMVFNVFLDLEFVMEDLEELIAKMDPMNLKLSALPLVQFLCLLAPMA